MTADDVLRFIAVFALSVWGVWVTVMINSIGQLVEEIHEKVCGEED